MQISKLEDREEKKLSQKLMFSTVDN